MTVVANHGRTDPLFFVRTACLMVALAGWRTDGDNGMDYTIVICWSAKVEGANVFRNVYVAADVCRI